MSAAVRLARLAARVVLGMLAMNFANVFCNLAATLISPASNWASTRLYAFTCCYFRVIIRRINAVIFMRIGA
jgi:hypothetical protein